MPLSYIELRQVPSLSLRRHGFDPRTDIAWLLCPQNWYTRCISRKRTAAGISRVDLISELLVSGSVGLGAVLVEGLGEFAGDL